MEYTETFQTTERYLEQQANQTIKGDPVLALVELITNSDDSYRKMELSGQSVTGKIIIQVAPRRREATIFEIYDNAMGMDDADMRKKVTLIGGDESGLTEETGGRSFFGRGLKECMIAFGKAEICSIKEGQHYRYLSFGVKVKPPEIRKATKDDYAKLQIPLGSNGTKVRLIAANPKLKCTPQFRNLARSLSFHYSLRDVVSNSKRIITLRYGSFDSRGKWNVKEEKNLSYAPPQGISALKKKLTIDEYPSAEATLEVFKTENRIPEATEKYDDERGFLICSKGAINDVYHFGFENHEVAGHIFGRVTCYYFDHLLRNEKDDTWINSSRDGMKWSHPFCKALTAAVLKELRPLYKQEQENSSKEKKQYENEETKRRVKKALDLFNQIAKEELDETTGVAKGIEKDGTETDPHTRCPPPTPTIPMRVPNGMAFTPNFVRMQVSKPKTITLKVELVGDMTKDSVISLDSTTSAFSIKDPLLRVADFMGSKIILEDGSDKIPIITMRTELFCDEVGVEGKIIASCNSKKAELEVVASESKSGGGLFSGYEFDPSAPKEQRVQYIRGTGIVKIATQAPSVLKYFGPTGENQDSAQARAILSELILDACCAELVRLRFGQEGFFFEDDPSAISEMFRFEVDRYKNRLAATLHQIIADK